MHSSWFNAVCYSSPHAVSIVSTFIIFPPASAWDLCVWRAVTLDLKIQAEFTATMEAAHVFISLWVCCKACVEREKIDGGKWECLWGENDRKIGFELSDSVLSIFGHIYVTFVYFSVLVLPSHRWIKAFHMPLERMRLLQRMSFKYPKSSYSSIQDC